MLVIMRVKTLPSTFRPLLEVAIAPETSDCSLGVNQNLSSSVWCSDGSPSLSYCSSRLLLVEFRNDLILKKVLLYILEIQVPLISLLLYSIYELTECFLFPVIANAELFCTNKILFRVCCLIGKGKRDNSKY